MKRATVLSGACAGAMLVMADIVSLVVSVPGALDPFGGIRGGAFSIVTAALPRALLFGAAIGVVQIAVILVLDLASARCARLSSRPERWFASAMTLLVTVGFAICAYQLLGGRWARSHRWYRLAAIGAGWLVGWFTYQVSFRAYVATRRTDSSSSVHHGGSGRGLVNVGLIVVLLLLASVSYVVDRNVLVRLYRPFHLGLQVGAFLALEIALVFVIADAGLPSALFKGHTYLTSGLAAALVFGGLFVFEATSLPGAAALNVLRLHGAIGRTMVDMSDRFTHPWVAPLQLESAGPPPSPDAPPAPGSPAALGANVLLITVDALRADHLETYGYTRGTSPNILELAHQSVVFERAYTSVPHTSFALTSLLTGYPALSLSERGVLDGTATLADFARANGYLTAAFFPSAVFFVEGERFRRFQERSFGFEVARVEDLPESTSAPIQTNRALAFLSEEAPERFFVWVHYFAPHEPYVDHPEAGPPFGKSAIDRYDGEVRWTDREIGRLVTSVRGSYPNTIVVLTADHGEEFGDHGGAYHGTTLYDEQVRVPLIISVPGLPGGRISAPVSTTSVVPTLVGATGMARGVRCDGADLSAWLYPSPPSESELPPAFAENMGQRMVTLGQEKLICDTRPDRCALFDLRADPREVVDLSVTHPDRAGVMRKLLDGWTRRLGSTGGWSTVADRSAPSSARRAAARAVGRTPGALLHSDLQVAWLAETDVVVKAWLAVALSETGDAEARAALPTLTDAVAETDDELRAHAALSRARNAGTRATSDLAGVLPRITDVNLRCALMHALATTGSPVAVEALLAGYDNVRSRICCAEALSTLRDRSTLPFIVGRLPEEPYINVQLALVRALRAIGDRGAIPVLEALRDSTPEALLIQTIDGALAHIRETPVRHASR